MICKEAVPDQKSWGWSPIFNPRPGLGVISVLLDSTRRSLLRSSVFVCVKSRRLICSTLRLLQNNPYIYPVPPILSAGFCST